MVLTLFANPTTGDVWETVSSAEPVLRQIGGAKFLPDLERLGGGGSQVMQFEAGDKGEASLELAYRRPWEERASPQDTFTVHVLVT